jgi:hypothetical protein
MLLQGLSMSPCCGWPSFCPPASTDLVGFLTSKLCHHCSKLLVSAASPGLKLVHFMDYLVHKYDLFEKCSMHVQNALFAVFSLNELNQLPFHPATADSLFYTAVPTVWNSACENASRNVHVSCGSNSSVVTHENLICSNWPLLPSNTYTESSKHELHYQSSQCVLRT